MLKDVKEKQEERKERYKFLDCTEEGKNAMNTKELIRLEDNLILLYNLIVIHRN